MEKPRQHRLVIQVDGETIEGTYTLVRKGRWDELTVWFRGRSLTDSTIAHEAEPGSTECIAEGMLQSLVERTGADE